MYNCWKSHYYGRANIYLTTWPRGYIDEPADLGVCCSHKGDMLTFPCSFAILALHKGRVKRKTSSIMRKMRRFKPSCTSAEYHSGLCSPFIHSIVFNDSVSREWMPWSDCANAQADLGLLCQHIPEDRFSQVFGPHQTWQYSYVSTCPCYCVRRKLRFNLRKKALYFIWATKAQVSLWYHVVRSSSMMWCALTFCLVCKGKDSYVNLSNMTERPL